MKKSFYIVPAIETSTIDDMIICASTISEVQGDTGIEVGTGETPTTADSRRTNVWGNVEAEEDW